MRFQPSQHSYGAGKILVAYFQVGDELYRVNEDNKTAALILSGGTRVSADKNYDAVKELIKSRKGKKIAQDVAIKLMKNAKAAVTKTTGLTAALIGKTWNDGKYTYVVDRNGNITIGSKTFKTGDAKYTAVATNLSKDYLDNKLKSGAIAAAPSVTYTPPAAPVSVPSAPAADAAAPAEGAAAAGEVPLTEQPWFWPAVIGGTVVAGGAIWYLFLREPAAPQPVRA